MVKNGCPLSSYTIYLLTHSLCNQSLSDFVRGFLTPVTGPLMIMAPPEPWILFTRVHHTLPQMNGMEKDQKKGKGKEQERKEGEKNNICLKGRNRRQGSRRTSTKSFTWVTTSRTRQSFKYLKIYSYFNMLVDLFYIQIKPPTISGILSPRNTDLKFITKKKLFQCIFSYYLLT